MAKELPPAKRQRTEYADGGDAAAGEGAAEKHFTEHFTNPEIDNLRIKEIKALAPPQLIMEEYPATAKCVETVRRNRRAASDVMLGNDDRVVVVVGPCAIHDPKSALEYAKRLKSEVDRFKDDLILIMRVYFEKPRTTVGWKGLINDPYLDESFRVNDGLRLGRRLLRDINELGVPCASEFLDMLTPQYMSDLVSWAAIGARTTECQTHRELVSGLSMPVGFKNSTTGDTDVAIDAILAAKHPHCFFSITKHGTAAIVHSQGNSVTQVVLRGGKSGTNFDARTVSELKAKLVSKGIMQGIMIDCSHGNSSKNHRNQPKVLAAVAEQVRTGTNVCGVMMESNLFEGRQDLPSAEALKAAGLDGSRPEDVLSRGEVESPMIKAGLLRYGVSVTDACVDWTTTVEMLETLAKAVRERRQKKGGS
mmetsp:Transcript_24224/g.53774  ORF Transcript_24224/g.53774 Transcript_24224/m.53774 type:complete len:421 (-) Transcript_24224:91-1353(-)